MYQEQTQSTQNQVNLWSWFKSWFETTDEPQVEQQQHFEYLQAQSLRQAAALRSQQQQQQQLKLVHSADGCEFTQVRNLENLVIEGDLIEFDRGLYKHWAMMSDVEGYVFNIPAESPTVTQTTITLERLRDVAGTSLVRVNNLEKEAKAKGLPPPRTLNGCMAAARAVLDKSVPYLFVGKNCEWYATSWRYGQGFSMQVEKGAMAIAETAIMANTAKNVYTVIRK